MRNPQDQTTEDPSLTPEHAVQSERACDGFEEAWRAGQRPSLEHFLEQAPAQVRRKLLRELLLLEADYRKRLGEPPTLDEYLGRFPNELTAAALVELLHWPVVSGYEILAEVGRGGMGVVYKARQLVPPRVVALKMIRDGALASPEQKLRFRREAEAAARFQHPNLVRIFEVGKDAGQPYFAMEFAEGGGLDRQLAGQPQPPDRAAQLMRTLAEAVQYAHDKQVVHRDLKSANVLLTADGRPLIADFGLAKRLDTDSAVTVSDAVLGTAGFMAPEQAAGGTKHVGPAADIYALGAVLYEMLTGRPPFRAETYQATETQVVHDDPVRPTELRAEVPPDLESICLKCLEKDPGQRYASAGAMAEDLNHFLNGEAIAAAPVSEWDRQVRWARRAGYAVDEALTYGVRDIVCKATQLHADRPVALKILMSPAAAEPAALDRFRQEARIVARLDHPNIVRIYDSGEVQGRPYLAFEYVGGGNLAERVADDPLAPREAAELTRLLAEAMQHTHSKGILHCALKASNVLLTPDGVPKITSFGLRVHAEEWEATRPLPSRRLPNYMAPELMDGRSADVGPTTDVYALGAILYALLTGEPPFQAETLAQTWEQARSQMPPPPSSKQAQVPAALDMICLRCLAKHPRERFSSAAELATALRTFLAG